MAMTREEFQSFLTPGRARFILSSIAGGLADYDNPTLYSPEAKRDHTPAVRAAIRNCHIVARAARASVDAHDVSIRAKRRRIIFTIADTVQLVFKKLDKNLQTRSIPTQQAVDYRNQVLDGLELPPKATNVFAGYRLGAVESEYEVFVTCPRGDDNQWNMQLQGAEVRDWLQNAADEAAANDIRPRVVLRWEEAGEGTIRGQGE